MAEPYSFRLTKTSNFDGSTPITLTRADLKSEGQRLYLGTLDGPGGIVDADFFGLFSPQSPKLVGLALSSFNPTSVVRVIDTGGRMREQVNLTQSVQYVLLHGGDRLAVLTRESASGPEDPVELSLFVNELSEREHVAWALAHPPAPVHTRLRIIRTQGSFEHVVAGGWIPSFEWDKPSSLLTVTDDAHQGPIPISALSPYPRRFGVLLTVRYAGSNNDGKVQIVENLSRQIWVAQSGLQDVRWSRVQYAAHDDMLLLEATPAFAGRPLVCDIELVRVEPGDRLRGRYAAPALAMSENL